MAPIFLSATQPPLITPDMLKPLVDGVSANIGVILPVGLGLFAIFIGIALVPKLIKKFTHS